MAKAALENALLDLLAKRRGLPLHALLGFPARRVMSGISIGIQETIPALLAKVEEAVASGYHRVKMKISRGKDVEWVEGGAPSAFPDLALMADANGDYTLEDAGLLARLDEFELTMIEQPLSYHDIYQHSLLQARLKTPLCLDESIHELRRRRGGHRPEELPGHQHQAGPRGRPARSGEDGPALRRHGIPAWSGGMDETGIGRALNIQLQTAPGLHPARRHLGDPALFPRRHRRAAGGAGQGRLHRHAAGTGHRRGRHRSEG